MRNWRYVVGSFIVRIPVAKPVTIRPFEKNIYSILSWRLTQMLPGNRWIPVLERYLGLFAADSPASASTPAPSLPRPGDPTAPPTQGKGTGQGPGKGGPGEPGEGIFGKGGLFGHDRDFIGKIEGIIYDRFGDFEGIRSPHRERNRTHLLQPRGRDRIPRPLRLARAHRCRRRHRAT